MMGISVFNKFFFLFFKSLVGEVGLVNEGVVMRMVGGEEENLCVPKIIRTQ